jgi:hypothetical protein
VLTQRLDVAHLEPGALHGQDDVADVEQFPALDEDRNEN